jgi:hypothetical protein
MGRGVSRLWMYFLSPPAQNSVLIYDDGSVVEGPGFQNSDIQADNVYMFILGGTRFRCETGSFEYDALTAAGYTWQTITAFDTYGEDYDDQYA